MSKLNLLDKIEACRKELISLSYEYGLTSQIVIESSMKLDQLINEYLTYEEYDECVSVAR